MVTTAAAALTGPASYLLLLSQFYRVVSAKAPAPSGANSNLNNGGISLSAIPGLGSIEKHKWWIWLLVSIAGAFGIVVAAFAIRGVLRYKRHKKIQQVKQQALNASRAEDEELGVGMFKPPPSELAVTNPMFVSAKPWDPMNSQEPLLLNAFRIPTETSLAGSRGLPQLPEAQSLRELERRTGRHGPRQARPNGLSGPADASSGPGLMRQKSM